MCPFFSMGNRHELDCCTIPGRNRIPGSRHTASATKESSSHKVSCVWKTPTFSALNNAKGTLFIDLTLCENGNGGENGSLAVVTLDTCMCVLSSLLVIDMNWIAARIPTNWQASQDIELKPGANVCSSSMAKVVGCSALSCWELEQATWFLVAGSKRIPGSRHTPTSATKESSSHKVSCVWKTPTFSALNNGKRTLFIDLTLCENGNCGENGSLAVVTLDTCMCVLCSLLVIDVNWIAARMSYPLATLERH